MIRAAPYHTLCLCLPTGYTTKKLYIITLIHRRLSPLPRPSSHLSWLSVGRRRGACVVIVKTESHFLLQLPGLRWIGAAWALRHLRGQGGERIQTTRFGTFTHQSTAHGKPQQTAGPTSVSQAPRHCLRPPLPRKCAMSSSIAIPEPNWQAETLLTDEYRCSHQNRSKHA